MTSTATLQLNATNCKKSNYRDAAKAHGKIADGHNDLAKYFHSVRMYDECSEQLVLAVDHRNAAVGFEATANMMEEA